MDDEKLESLSKEELIEKYNKLQEEKEALYILRHLDQYSQISIGKAIRKINRINSHRLDKLKKEKLKNKELLKNSIPKKVIIDKIEKLKSKGKIINQTFPNVGEYIYYKEIKVLTELLERGIL